MKSFKIIELVFLIVLLMYMTLVTYVGFTQAEFKERCRDAGGIPTSDVCINPGSIIEVN